VGLEETGSVALEKIQPVGEGREIPEIDGGGENTVNTGGNQPWNSRKGENGLRSAQVKGCTRKKVSESSHTE